MNILLVINEIFFLSKVTVKFDIFTVKIPPSRFDTFAISSLCQQVGKELNFNAPILIRMFILQGKSGENSAVVRVYVEESFSTFNAVRYHSN